MLSSLNKNGNYTTFSKQDKWYKLNNFNLREDFFNTDLPLILTVDELKELVGGLFPDYIKEFLQKKVSLYGSSSNVDSFIYKNKEYWFNKEQRASLRGLTIMDEDLDILIGDEIKKFTPQELNNFLNNLEMYSHKCFLATAKHLKEVESLKTLEEIINYDYTSGYPDKITLE